MKAGLIIPAILLATTAGAGLASAHGPEQGGEHPLVTPRLMADTAAVEPGQSFRLGVMFQMRTTPMWARAKQMIWRCPLETLLPPSPTWVSRPDGRFSSRSVCLMRDTFFISTTRTFAAERAKRARTKKAS